MELEELQAKTFSCAPPIMPWRAFAAWIGMEEEQGIVQAWIQRGMIPSVRIGKHRMVNVALLTKELLEKEEI